MVSTPPRVRRSATAVAEERAPKLGARLHHRSCKAVQLSSLSFQYFDPASATPACSPFFVSV
jgi:hypothetical protein